MGYWISILLIFIGMSLKFHLLEISSMFSEDCSSSFSINAFNFKILFENSQSSISPNIDTRSIYIQENKKISIIVFQIIYFCCIDDRIIKLLSTALSHLVFDKFITHSFQNCTKLCVYWEALKIHHFTALYWKYNNDYITGRMNCFFLPELIL